MRYTVPEQQKTKIADEITVSNEMTAVRAMFEARGGGRYFINTYGCQMNERDSDALAAMLDEMGCVQADSVDEADIVLFNTCCVRERAEWKVLGNVGALKPAKQVNPDLIIVVCGCMMQQKDAAKQLHQRYPFVDIIFGTENLPRFPHFLLAALQGESVLEILDDKKLDDTLAPRRRVGASAFVSIMVGCDNFCSYCIVPYVRGRERSYSPERVLKEVRGLAENGCKEVTLLGQNVNSYGRGEGLSFAKLLKQVATVDGIERVRFMTPHPKDLSMELIEAMASTPKVCKQLHLPVQCGSNAVLEAMNRGYTVEHYRTLVRDVRAAVGNDIGLSTDIIVGFPGESEQDFQQTMDLMAEVRYHGAYMFAYSKRRGTEASELPNQVEAAEKSRRLNALIHQQDEITLQWHEGYVGRTVPVLLESKSRSKKGAGQLTGRTDSGRTVIVSADEAHLGTIAQVHIDAVKGNVLGGTILTD